MNQNAFITKEASFLFSGQGSQFYGMTQLLYNKNEEYRRLLQETDEITHNILSISVLKLLFDSSKKNNCFDDLLTSSIALAECQYCIEKLLESKGIYPDIMLGASMGEIIASAIASDEEFAVFIRLIAEIVEAICKECNHGGMVSILERSNIFFDIPDMFTGCELSGINYNRSFVVSGSDDAIENLIKGLLSRNIAHMKLPVKYAFHSSMMAPAENRLKQIRFPFELKTNVASCAYGNIINKVSDNYVWNVIREPVMFSKAFASVEKSMSPRYIDLSPNHSMSNYLKRMHIPHERNCVFSKIIL